MSVNVDGVRRLVNISPGEMTDDDLRRALVRHAAGHHPDDDSARVAEVVRRFGAAMDRLAL